MKCCDPAPCEVTIKPVETTTETVKPTEESITEPGKGNGGMLVRNDVMIVIFCLAFAYIIFV